MSVIFSSSGVYSPKYNGVLGLRYAMYGMRLEEEEEEDIDEIETLKTNRRSGKRTKRTLSKESLIGTRKERKLNGLTVPSRLYKRS